jgi:hypothetical protein
MKEKSFIIKINIINPNHKKDFMIKCNKKFKIGNLIYKNEIKQTKNMNPNEGADFEFNFDFINNKEDLEIKFEIYDTKLYQKFKLTKLLKFIGESTIKLNNKIIFDKEYKITFNEIDIIIEYKVLKNKLLNEEKNNEEVLEEVVVEEFDLKNEEFNNSNIKNVDENVKIIKDENVITIKNENLIKKDENIKYNNLNKNIEINKNNENSAEDIKIKKKNEEIIIIRGGEEEEEEDKIKKKKKRSSLTFKKKINFDESFNESFEIRSNFHDSKISNDLKSSNFNELKENFINYHIKNKIKEISEEENINIVIGTYNVSENLPKDPLTKWLKFDTYDADIYVIGLQGNIFLIINKVIFFNNLQGKIFLIINI